LREAYGHRRGHLDTLVGVAAACALLVAMTEYAGASEDPPSSAPSQPSAEASDDSSNWRDSLSWRGQEARVSVRLDGKYVLNSPVGERVIAAQRWRVRTASPLFDALFAMAQEDLNEISVDAITDAAFDHGQPIRCRCFIAGQQWPFVWTRDVSYSIDLGLWRLDPARARASLLFKVSPPRAGAAPPGLYVMQDTGSGGSWPISTDRVVWFLGARHLLEDQAFADTVYEALTDTLAQDRRYVFDPRMGLYRGETSFLDWREQSYPAWTAHNVVFIAQSFALSTNVLHYQALNLAAEMAQQRRQQAAAARYLQQAATLKQAINVRFWRPDRGLYMSYIGGPVDPQPFDAYDLLALDLAITSGVVDSRRAIESLEHYPAWPAGSPVIWPEKADEPIYHNRAIWPFVSEYTLRAARRVGAPSLIALEVQSLMRGAALNASNMENYSLLSQSTHVPGMLGGPVVDSPRQLWSVAGYLDMVLRGVFGLEDDGRIVPVLPVSLVPMLFGRANRISLELDGRQIVLDRPVSSEGPLLVAGSITHEGDMTEVQLVAAPAQAGPPPMTAAVNLTPALATPRLRAGSDLGPVARIDGPWPRHWTAGRRGEYVAWLDYSNPHGPINTGITAAVKRLQVLCAGSPRQVLPIVLPHSEGWQASTTVRFEADAGASCDFSLLQGFNMSDLAQFARYTGPAPAPMDNTNAGTNARTDTKAGTKTGIHTVTGTDTGTNTGVGTGTNTKADRKAGIRRPAGPQPAINGGVTGPLNSAQIGALRIGPLADEGERL